MATDVLVWKKVYSLGFYHVPNLSQYFVQILFYLCNFNKMSLLQADRPNSANRQINEAGCKQNPHWQTRDVPTAAAATTAKYENYDIVANSPRKMSLDPHSVSSLLSRSQLLLDVQS